MTDVVLGQEVPDRGVTAPPLPDLRSRLEEVVWRLGVPPSGRSLLAGRGPYVVGRGDLARKGAGPRKCFARAISSHPCDPWYSMSYAKVSYIRDRWLCHYI